MRVAIYARVSTDGQSTDNQVTELRRVAAHHRWTVVEEFVDQGVSCVRGRDQRPAFDKLLRGAIRRDFDLVMGWSVDRLGRSLQHLVGFLGELQAKDVGLYLHQQGIDTTTPAGRAMFQMYGVFAEFERAMIQARVKAGLARAVAQGRKLRRPRVSPTVESNIRQARNAGKGIRAIASEFGVGVSVVQRVVGAASSAAAAAT